MSLITDHFIDFVETSLDNGATREDWEHALDLVFGAPDTSPADLPTGKQTSVIADVLTAHTSMRETVRAELDQYPDDGPGTEQRVHARVQLLFDLAYDDDEPQTPIQDILIDLMHEAARRGVDFKNTLTTARRHWRYEREEFGLDKKG